MWVVGSLLAIIVLGLYVLTAAPRRAVINYPGNYRNQIVARQRQDAAEKRAAFQLAAAQRHDYGGLSEQKRQDVSTAIAKLNGRLDDETGESYPKAA